MIRTGDLFERSFETAKGSVDVLAEVVVEGDTLILKDICVYARSSEPLSGLAQDAFAARTQLIGEVRNLGFKTLRIIGRRVEGSSSGNPGHLVDVTVQLGN